MHCQIIYSSKYGSTKLLSQWIGEKLFHHEVKNEIISVQKAIVCTEANHIVLISPVYSGKALKEFTSFIKENQTLLSQKSLSIVCVAMQKERCFNNQGMLNIISEFPQLHKSIIHQEVLLGEMIYSNMTKEDQTSLYDFYTKIMKLEDENLKQKLESTSLLNKTSAWELASIIIKNIKKGN